MDVLEALSLRRTVHLYKEGEISPSLLREALTMALYAPNHKFTFPWKFLIVGHETRAALQEISKKISIEKKQGSWTVEDEVSWEAKCRKKVLNPGALVVFCCAHNEDSFRQREDYATVACSIQNFCLALTAHGYGTKWSTGALTRRPETYSLLGVEPKEFEIVGFVWAGVAEEPAPPRKRPELDDVLDILP